MELTEIKKQEIEDKTEIKELKIRLFALEELLVQEGVIVKGDVKRKENEILKQFKEEKEKIK